MIYDTSCTTPTTGTFVELFTSAVQIFAASHCLISEGILEDADIPNHSKFDVIIIGAGTSGCVLAKRLCENKVWRILLIEAGGDPPIEADVPNLDAALYRTKFDWQYLTTNDGKINQANIDGSINWPRGKGIGGSSNINAMIYAKGNDYDYKIWYDAGNKEWSIADVRRCFKKAESYQNMRLSENNTIYEQYGHNGPLVINTFNSTIININEKVLSAFDSIGIKRVLDLNTENMFGAGITTVTAANGEKQSLNKAYLNTAKCKKQLVILKNTLVTKILINDSTKVAYGVTVRSERSGKKMTYYANKEVILSAGSINSPQLLMLSGVGPKTHLSKNNIKVVAHSPMVGQNLQDHCIIPIIICCNESNPESGYDQYFDVFKYIYNRTGYLAQGHISDVLAFFSFDKNAVRPDYQSHFAISWKNSSNIQTLMKKQFRYKDSVADPIIKLNKNYTLFIFLFNLLHPDSRGNISLQSNNPEQHPFIYPNYFKDNNDLESAINGIKMLTKILDTDYFKSIGAFLARMEWPECNKYELDSRDYWKCVCINMVLTVYHPVGTNMIGSDPKSSAVDSRLRVHGVSNLRVIDASIMPNITSGNTNGPSTMIGERGAELVLEDHENEC